SVSSGGGTTITLTGTNLVGDADSEFVELNYGTHAKVPIACSPDGTTCTTMTPLVWWGSGDVELFVVAAGGTSNSLSLTFVPTPVVMEVNPSQGPLAGGTAITVLGANFV